MAKFKLLDTDKKIITPHGDGIYIVLKDKFDGFNEDILGLGKIDTKSSQLNALSVFFDLEGFTAFCKQIDPQLAVPEYLSEFLKWIFKEIKTELLKEKYDEGYSTWADLPLLSKYLGDGLLFIWDTQNMHEMEILNVVISMYAICTKYKSDFLPKIAGDISSPPNKLRCGIARGVVYSVGDENDYVGPCINMSARLQKLNLLTFCFSRRGINPAVLNELYRKLFIVKRINIRGIGDEELVCVLKDEFERLPPEERKKFTKVQ